MRSIKICVISAAMGLIIFGPPNAALGYDVAAEIEKVLLEHPAIHDVGVFGIPDEEWGESVKAAVELRRGFEPSPALETAILDFARENLARYKVPRSVDFEPKLPRHDSGKLYVRLLRERYWKGRERRI